ncbi:helix-turn-helix domain-containing protein [Chamaesiphon sp. VAR_48_metabat_403]|uniref:TetR/AcrR family transcriptional regulator n=1 Tax=Chamaesiphon sp. VAR_48_metabat_403 TaxID=2964700 RepID=UPI00286D8ADD|nr:helix-turn-helix domain-containing protein [Chamaesiphon sp. VAR_48_metabat_403]
MPRPPKITNEEILTAAREVFLAQGESVSTLEIAEKAGISEASIFKRFSTKQALFLAAIGISEIPQYVKLLSSQTPTAEIRSELTEICTQMAEFYQEVMPRVIMMMTQTKSSLPPLVPPPLRDSQLFAGYLNRAIAQVTIASLSPSFIELGFGQFLKPYVYGLTRSMRFFLFLYETTMPTSLERGGVPPLKLPCVRVGWYRGGCYYIPSMAAMRVSLNCNFLFTIHYSLSPNQ